MLVLGLVLGLVLVLGLLSVRVRVRVRVRVTHSLTHSLTHRMRPEPGHARLGARSALVHKGVGAAVEGDGALPRSLQTLLGRMVKGEGLTVWLGLGVRVRGGAQRSRCCGKE